jgi:hypothetical protein
MARHMMIALACLGGLALVGTAGWAVMGRRPATVPVIEADSRPIRIKPENPGGMQVAGADEQDGVEKMAPPPEAPAPQALRAQMQQSAPKPEAAPPATASTTAAPTASAPAALTSASPLPDTPTRPQPATRAAPMAAPPAPPLAQAAPIQQAVPPARPAAGGALVQVAAVESEAAAQSEWQRLAKKMPDLLGDHRPSIQKAERDGKVIWRVRTGGFADIAEATGFCAKMRAKGGACTIASF